MLSQHWDEVVAFVFGDDIFVSYSREDGATYAAGVATELTNLGFTTRLDQWGTEPDEEMPARLKRALRRSAALVLVATPGAARSQHVADEVAIVKRAKRLIVPIVFPGVRLRDGSAVVDGKVARQPPAELAEALQDALWAKDIVGLPLSIEASGASKPSAQARERIEKTCTFRRRNNRLRSTAAVLVAALVVLLGAAGVTAYWAAANANEAAANAKEAARQTDIARGQGAAAASQTLRVRSMQQADWNDSLQQSALLAIEAASRLGGLGFSPLESQRSLRDVLDMLPRSVRQLSLDRPVDAVYVAPDGSRVATQGEHETLQIWDAKTGRKLAEPPSGLGWQIDSTVAVLATIQPKGISLRSLIDPASVRELALGPVQAIKFSPDGSRIVAIVGQRRSTLEVRDVESGKKTAEIQLAGAAVDVALSQDNETLGVSMDGPGSGQTIIETWNIDQAPVRLTHQKVLVDQEILGTSHGTLQGLVFSPDGSKVAGESGYHVLVLNARTATRIFRLKPLEQDQNSRNDRTIHRFFFSPDGKTIGLTISDGSYEVWNVRAEASVDSSPTGFFDDHMMGDSPVFGIPSPNGLRLMDIRTGRPLVRAFHGGKTRPCGWSDQGRFVAVCGDRELWIYEAGSAQQTALVSRHKTHLDLGLLRARSKVAVQVSDDGKEPVVLRYKGELASSVVLNRGRTLAAAVVVPPGAWTSAYKEDPASTRMGDLVVWDLTSGRESLRIPGVLGIVQPEGYDEAISATGALYFSPLGRFVVLGSKTPNDEDVATVWATGDGHAIARDVHASALPSSMTFTADDQFLTITENSKARVVETASGEAIANLEDVGFEMNRQRGLLSQRAGKGIRVSKLDGKVLYEIVVAGEDRRSRFSNSGNYLAVAGSRKVELIEAASGKRILSSDFEEDVDSIDFDPDEHYLMAFGHKKHLATWALADARKLAFVTSAQGSWDTKFSRDGDCIVVARPKSVEVWSVQRGALDMKIDINGKARDLDISDDARYLAIHTEGEDVVRVWEHAGAWREFAAFPTEGFVTKVQFTADSDELVVASGGKETAWMLSSRKLADKACAALTRNLTAEEWRRAFGDTPYRATCAHLGG